MSGCLGRVRQGLRLATRHTSYPAPGTSDWLLSVTSIQVIERRGIRGRQPTGMASHVSPYIRIPFFHERGPGVGVDLTLQERMDELFSKENNQERVNIGFKKVGGKKTESQDLEKWKREIRNNKAMEKAARLGELEVDLDNVKNEWLTSGAAFDDIYDAGVLYGIFEDLFRHGYFHPCVNLDVAFPQEDDMMVPVFRGNLIKPFEASSKPEVSWQSENDSDLWCLAMTGLDTHLTEPGQEYLHWMVANVRGSDLNSGQELLSFLQPFPPMGTGYHRYAFVLYKQEQHIDFDLQLSAKDTVSLQERTFNTFNFYSKYQDRLTPAGLAFFQSDYDSSLRNFFHNTLNMKEPKYEYEFPLPYIKQWNSFKMRISDKGFNEFLDRHRDPKDIEKEVFVKKLKHTHPYLGDTEAHIKYPEAHLEDLLEVLPEPVGQKRLNRNQSYKIPSWRRAEIMREKSKHGYYSSTEHSHLRRDPAFSSQ